MNYSPVNGDLFSSFNKIGNEIDDIFSNLDIFHASSEQFNNSSEKFLKGGSSVDFLGHKESDELPVQKLSFASEVNEIAPVQKSIFPDVTKELRTRNQAVDLARLTSTPSKQPLNSNITDSSTASLHSVAFTNLASALVSRPSDNVFKSSSITSVLKQNESLAQRTKSPENARVPDTVSKEKELCRKHQHEIKGLRDRILGLTDRIQVTVDERNKVFFKLEAAVREIANQGVKKEILSQKVQDLNQKMLENDYEINQLRSQITELDGQIDATQSAHLTLLDKLEHTYVQLDQLKEERENVLRVAQRSDDTCTNLLQKYQLLQRIHEHCGTVKDNDQAERQTLFNRVDELNRVISAMQKERTALIENLGKVHKLVDKLERKATDKIQVLSRELKDLQNSNSSLRESTQEKDATLAMNRATIRDLESKLIECERETADVKQYVQTHQRNQQDAIATKNKKIKILSLKVKQLQTRMQTQISQISILTETNERLEENLREEKLKNKTTAEDALIKDAAIDKLKTALDEQAAKLQCENTNRKLQAELESSVAELVQQKEAIQNAMVQLEDTNKSRLAEIDDLRHTLASTELEHDANLHELNSKLVAKTRRISKLKEGINELVSGRQDTMAELQEVRFAVRVLQEEARSTQQDREERERDLAADLKEKSIQLEQYKEMFEKLELEQRSRAMDMESEYDLVSAAVKVSQLEAENNHLKAALQKSKDKHSRLRQSFSDKIREQNEIIDNCVDKEAAEKQIADLHAHYSTLFSQEPSLEHFANIKSH